MAEIPKGRWGNYFLVDEPTMTHTLRNFQQRDVERTLAAGRILNASACGCIQGDAKIPVNRGGIGRTYPLEELVTKFNGGSITVPTARNARRAYSWNPDIPTLIQQEREGEGVFRSARLKAAWCSGEKETYTLTTPSRQIRATTRHPFLTLEGWAELQDLRIGDQLHVLGTQTQGIKKPKIRYARVCRMQNHPFANHYARGGAIVARHRLAAEAHLNDLSLDDYIRRIQSGIIEGITFLDPKEWAVHHDDRDPTHNEPSNLKILTHKEHQRLHAQEGNLNNVLYKVATEEILSITPFGVEPTYDLEVDDEFPHNFTANGFVVHNTGKTIVASRAVDAHSRYPCLVACPTYLVDTWAAHLLDEGHAPDQIIVAATTASRTSPRAPAAPSSPRSISPQEKRDLIAQSHDPNTHFIIVNHEMLRQPPAQREKSVQRIWDETAAAHGWDNLAVSPAAQAPASKPRRKVERYKIPLNIRSVIYDETHRFRGAGPSGHGSQTFRGAYQIATRHKVELVQLLTATPIYKDVGDLYNQLRIVDPPQFTSRWAFLTAHAILDEDPWGTRVIGARPSARHLLSRYAILHDYSDPDVQLEIPPCIPRELRCNMTPASKAAHQKIKRQHRDTSDQPITDSTSSLVELRMVTAHDPEKLKMLDDLLADVGPQGYILFTHYRETAALLAARYDIPVAMGGEKDNPQTARSVGPNRSRLGLAATIDSLQEGLDLSHLRVVIFYESLYTPGSRTQALMRVQRFRTDGKGHTDSVLAYWLIARDSIDERVNQVANTRGATSQELMRLEMQAA